MQGQVGCICLSPFSPSKQDTERELRIMWPLTTGLMYLRLPINTNTAAYNRAAGLWVAMFAFTLMPSETACTVWNQERAVVRGLTQPMTCIGIPASLDMFYYALLRDVNYVCCTSTELPTACTLYAVEQGCEVCAAGAQGGDRWHISSDIVLLGKDAGFSAI